MRLLLSLIWMVLGASAFASNPPSILNNSNHIVTDATTDLTVLGIPFSSNTGPTSAALAVNQSCPGACTTFIDPASIVGYATNLSHQEYAAGTSTAVTPAVPYQIINQSSSGYTLAGFEQANYAALEANSIVYSMAYCGIPGTNDYPPVAFVTVLPNTIGATPFGTSGCGYSQGIEFSIPATGGTWTPISGGGSMDVSSPSATTEAMSAVLAALKFNHPNWTWNDVKSVLRVTASNWSTGYVAYNSTGPALGYGNVNYTLANSYTGTIYLQPPGLAIQNSSTDPVLTIYPFVTTRRSGEVIYAFHSRPKFPSPGSMNEYPYSEITALATTYNGSLVYNSKGAAGTQTFLYPPPSIKTPVYFVAFTVDNISQLNVANYSRAEIYSAQRVFYANPAINLINRLLLPQ